MLLPLGDRHIHYDLLGRQGASVVCLAHALSADTGIWAEQVPPLLAAGWRVLRLDMRGHGGSTPGEDEVYTMQGLAADVVAVLDDLGLDAVHFAGLSIGGMIGQVLAVEHPERLLSAMLCDTAPTTIPGGKATWDERFAAIAKAGSVEPLADATLQRWLTEDFQRANPARYREVWSSIALTSPQGYIGGGNAILHFDSRPHLASVKVPTFVVWGDQDPGTPPEGNQLIADLIPGAGSHVFRGARHVPMVEYPEDFSAVMLDWLMRLRSGSCSV
ncbi:MAG TPA: alpha/beta fold hydrolase [Novosphingobium sp.]